LYRDENGKLKGDGWISYLKPESVGLAIQFLDETEIKSGFPISVKEVLHLFHAVDLCDGQSLTKTSTRLILKTRETRKRKEKLIRSFSSKKWPKSKSVTSSV